jgi:hypothetical protein
MSKSGRTRRVCFDQNTACGSVFFRSEPHGRGRVARYSSLIQAQINETLECEGATRS